jgi:RNA polymerase sigma factor (sigma-70 family)
MGRIAKYNKLTDAQCKRVEENMGLARHSANSVFRQLQGNLKNIPFTYDDFYAIACLSLCVASQNYDPELGIAFSTFAISSMKRSIWKEVSRKSSLVRFPANKRDNICVAINNIAVSLDAPHIDNGKPCTLLDLLSEDDSDIRFFELIHTINQVLDDKEKYVFLSHKLNKVTQAQLGKKLGLSQATAGRICKKATAKLKESICVN